MNKNNPWWSNDINRALINLKEAVVWEPSESDLDQQKQDIQEAALCAQEFSKVTNLIDELFPTGELERPSIKFAFRCYVEEEVTDVDSQFGVVFNHEQHTWYISINKDFGKPTTIAIILAAKSLRHIEYDENIQYQETVLVTQEVDGKKVSYFPSLPAKQVIKMSQFLPRFLDALTEGIIKRREQYV